MSGDSRWPLQQAVRTALLANAEITALVGAAGVYDDVPDQSVIDSLLPYLVIGEMSAVDASDKNEDGIAVTLVMWAWSQFRGYKEIYQMLAPVHDVLHFGEAGLSVTGHVVVRSQFLNSDVGRDEDGITRFGTARYLIETCPL